MIQRIQSIWLFLAAMLSLSGIITSFFSGNKLNTVTNLKEWSEFTADLQIHILLTTIVLALAILTTIFLYKNRMKQIVATIICMGFSVINILLYLYAKRDFIEAKLDLGSLCGFGCPIFLYWAAKAIYKDELIVKQSDRLR